MVRSRLLAGLIALAAAGPAAAGGGSGLVLPTLDALQWRLRFEFDPASTLRRSLSTAWAVEQAPLSGRLTGEYPIDALRFGQTGGLRLTSGVLVTLRRPATFTPGSTYAAAADDGHSVLQPYAGIGYSTGDDSVWAFRAELGLAAQNPGAVARFGRFSGNFSLGDTVRDLRLQPMIRLGMHYEF